MNKKKLELTLTKEEADILLVAVVYFGKAKRQLIEDIQEGRNKNDLLTDWDFEELEAIDSIEAKLRGQK